MNFNLPDLKNNYDVVVKELLDKFRLMRSFYIFRIHHVLQINLIEAENMFSNILTFGFMIPLIKPESATEGVDNNI